MTVVVTVRQTYRNVPIEITAETQDVPTLAFTEMLERLRQVVDGWAVAGEKRRRRAWRKMVKPLPFHTMSQAKFLFSNHQK